MHSPEEPRHILPCCRLRPALADSRRNVLIPQHLVDFEQSRVTLAWDLPCHCREVMVMIPTDIRVDSPIQVPEKQWPDGTSVSAWSKATGTMPGDRRPENYRAPVTIRGRGD